MEISRKRFSDFLQKESPRDMYFVGYKIDENDPMGQKKINVKLHYDLIKKDIEEWIMNNGGGGSVTPSPDEPHVPVLVNETMYYPLTFASDVGEGEIPTWNEEEESHIVNLGRQKGFVEINGGGDYISESVFFTNPAIGSVTSIVVDNTGKDHNENDLEESWKPIENFILYFGLKDNKVQVLEVPPFCRGVVQLLHTKETDIVINATYTDMMLDYIRDVIPTNEFDDSNEPVEGEITNQEDKLYVDMKNESGFIELTTNNKILTYSFIFENTELGSTTYIVLDNTNGIQNVAINYGKKYLNDDESITNIETEVMKLEMGYKAIIEVFHSLSADIIVNTIVV